VARRRQNNHLNSKQTLSDRVGSPGQKHLGRVESWVKGDNLVPSLPGMASQNRLGGRSILTIVAKLAS